MILSLDIADKMGVAYTFEDKIYTEVISFKKLSAYESANKQLNYICDFPLDTIILIEEFVYYGNSNRMGQSDLVKRLGFIEYSLISLGYSVTMLNVNSVRKGYCVDKPKQKRIIINDKGKYKLIGIKPKDWIQKEINNHTGLKLTNDQTDAILMIMNYKNLSYEDIQGKVLPV